MTAQTSDTMCNLDECVKVAEMSASKLLNDSSQHNPITYHKHVNIQYKIANDGFPKFSKLPAELRSKVWQDAMPPYGIFTALMLGHEEPRPQQPPPPAILAFRVVYRLEPVPRDQQDDELRTRLDTMRAIQWTNSEAASEVERAFPTTISCTDGKLRFNADHDTLSLSDTQYRFASGASKRFGRYTEGAVHFADDWHKIPTKMLLNNLSLAYALCSVNGWLRCSTPYSPWIGYSRAIQQVEGLMQFLADCTALRSFGFTYNKACRDTVLQALDLGRPQFQALRLCDPAPIMKGSFYGNYDGDPLAGLEFFLSAFLGLEAVVHGQRPAHLPEDWQGMRFRRPELQHLHIRAMVPASPALSDRIKKMRGGNSGAEGN